MGRLCQRGQAAAVRGYAVLLVVIVVLAYALTEIRSATIEERKGTTNTYITRNSAIDSTATHWENTTAGTGVTVGTENITATDWVLFARSTDNDAEIENAVWYQMIAVKLNDEVTSAALKFKWALAENTGLGGGNVALKVMLTNPAGTDYTIWQTTVTATSNLAAIENDVKSYITADGDYTLKLRAELNPQELTPSVKVQWDDASLTVDSYVETLGETVARETGPSSLKVFVLLLLVVIIAIIAVVLRAIGAL